MKREIRDIIENDVVIPDIVLQAKEEAFAKIPDAAAPSEEKAEVALVKKTGRKFKKKWIAVAMVAVLAVGTLSAGAAAGGFDSGLLKFMGITDLQPGDLKVASKELDATFVAHGIDYLNNPEGEEKDVAITITEVIGDDTTAYFRMDIDYELPEDFSLDKYMLKWEYTDCRDYYSDSEMTKMVEHPEDEWGRPIYENGKVSYMWRIQGLDDIGEKYIHWKIHNLYLYEISTGEYVGEVVFEGEWDMKFQLAYESEEPIVINPNTSITIQDAELVSVEDVDGKRNIRDVDVMISEIEITPLCIRLEGKADFDPTLEEDLHFMYSLDKITYKDGTVIEYDYSNFTSAFKYNATLQSYPEDNVVYGSNDMTQMFAKAIDLDKIESITINGIEIKVK
ncbi:MAG: hypothetical protein IJ471_04905 [Eubacterium sp.]|nr:hypothetical protein [Eubacterium sp.]